MVSSVQYCAHEKNQWFDLKFEFVLFSVGAQSWSLRPVCSCDLLHWRENLWGSNSYWLFASSSQYSWETCCKICFHLWESLCSLLFLCFTSLSFCFFSFHRTFFIAAFSGPPFFFSLLSCFCVSLHFHLWIFSLSLCLSSSCPPSCLFLCPPATSEMSCLSTHVFWVSSPTMSSPHRGTQNKLSPSWLVLPRLHHSSPSVWTHKTHIHTLFQGLGNVSMRVQPLPFYPRRRDSMFSVSCCFWYMFCLHPQLSALSLDSHISDSEEVVTVCFSWTLINQWPISGLNT